MHFVIIIVLLIKMYLIKTENIGDSVLTLLKYIGTSTRLNEYDLKQNKKKYYRVIIINLV